MRYLLPLLLATVANAQTYLVTWDSRIDEKPVSGYQTVDVATPNTDDIKEWVARGVNLRSYLTPHLIDVECGCGTLITGTVEQAQAELRTIRARTLPVTPRQFKLALLGIGITPDIVEAQLATITNDMVRIAAQIEWREASVFKRSHPLVSQVNQMLGGTEQMLDDLFIAAQEIE